MRRLIACISLVTALQVVAQVPQAAPVSAAPDVDLFKRNTQVFSIHGSFLFWRVQESALDYALKMRTPAWGPTASYAQGKFETATFDGDPGFRIETGFFRASRYWELWTRYTRLTARGGNHSDKPEPADQYLTGTWPQIFTLPMSRATSTLHMNYNLAELLIDRFFNPNPHLRLRMIGGGIAAWIDQDWHIHYHDTGSYLTKVRNRWKFVGGGITLGTMVDWYWGYNIYLTGRTTASVLMGCYRNRAEQTTNFQPTASDDTSVPVRDADYRDIRPAFSGQAMLGPSWQKNFSSTRLELFAGYELQTWFNLQEVYRSTSGSASAAKETWLSTGMIALQGLTARFTADF